MNDNQAKALLQRLALRAEKVTRSLLPIRGNFEQKKDPDDRSKI